jgi:hypothetical protein
VWRREAEHAAVEVEWTNNEPPTLHVPAPWCRVKPIFGAVVQVNIHSSSYTVLSIEKNREFKSKSYGPGVKNVSDGQMHFIMAPESGIIGWMNWTGGYKLEINMGLVMACCAPTAPHKGNYYCSSIKWTH